MTYKRGNVVLVEAAFTVAGTGSKKQPAVVVGTTRFNAAGTKLIVATITGSLAPPSRPGDVILTDWIYHRYFVKG